MTIRVWGFDPGLTVGVAVIDCGPFGVEHVYQTTHMWYEDALKKYWLPKLVREYNPEREHHIVVENFVGAGPVSREGRITTQLAGFWYFMGQQMVRDGLFTGAALVNSDKRLSMNSRAEQLIRDKTGQDPQRDQLSAMAHALAYAERNGSNVRR